MHLRVTAMTKKSIRYTCVLTRRGHENRHRHAGHRLRAPPAERADDGRRDSRRRSRPAFRSRPTRRQPRARVDADQTGDADGAREPSATTESAIAARQSRRLEQLLARDRRPQSRSTRSKLDGRGHRSDRRAALSRRSRDAAGHDQDRARRRSGGASALGHGAERAARALHALHPDVVHHRTSAALAGHQRELAVDARVLEGRLSRRAGRTPAIGSSSPSRSGRSSASGRRSTPRGRSARTPFPAGGMSSQQRLAMIDAVAPDGRVLHADLRASAGRSRWRADGRIDGRWRTAPSARSSSRASRAAAFRRRASASNGRWGARVFDQHGLTEVGPVSFECWEQPGSAARERERVHLRGGRSGDARAGRRRPAGRAAADQSRPDRPAR